MSRALLPDVRKWHGKIRHVGAFSRFDGRGPEPSDRPPGTPRRVLLMQGSGGSEVTADDLRQAVASTPGWTWDALGGIAGRWAEDPWPALCQADVVVAHGGLSAIAEIAAARKPAIVLPQARPHGEQTVTARALADAGLAITVSSWPRGNCWPAVLEAAQQNGGSQWAKWSSGTGAQQAARLIESVAARTAGSGIRCALPS